MKRKIPKTSLLTGTHIQRDLQFAVETSEQKRKKKLEHRIHTECDWLKTVVFHSGIQIVCNFKSYVTTPPPHPQ